MTLALVCLVALGASLGAPARYLVNHLLRQRFGATATAGTLVVNVAGSFLIGMLTGWTEDKVWLALVGIGFCGAFTTFSTFALELWDALEDRRVREAVANVGLSLTLGVLAAWAGWSITG